MSFAKPQAYGSTLPQATSGVKWGADLCFPIDAKMFAVFGIDLLEAA